MQLNVTALWRTLCSTLLRTLREIRKFPSFLSQYTSPICSADLCFQDINDTVGILRDNINKANDRGQRLDALQDKTDNLAVSAQGFRRGANRVRKQMWWKDMKMRICIIVGILILLLIIIIPSGT